MTAQSAHTVSTDFERTTREIRWVVIGIILITFPLGSPQAPYVYGLSILAALYNASRYIPSLQRIRGFQSPALMLIVDSLFVGALITGVGYITSPYSAFLVFMIVTAAYLYQMRGTILIVLLEGAALLSVVAHPFFPPITVDTMRSVVVIISVLLLLGFLVARLTHQERVERTTLESLREKSEQEQLRLLTLVDSLSSAIFVTDDKGVIVQCNESARILVDAQSDLIGKNFTETMPVYRRNDPERITINILDEKDVGTQHRRDLCLLTRTGDRIDLDISIAPVWIGAGYIFVCEDISRERSLEEERSEFIAAASHEIRTPLAIIEGALESVLVPGNELPERVKKLLQQAHQKSLQLGDIVKDLAIIGESQNDSIPVQLAQVNPQTLIEECAQEFTAQAQQKGITLTTYIAPKTPVILSTEQHIREILQNYLTNALKYSQKGTITIKAEPAASGGALLSVEDQGIGISPRDQAMLFTKFFRAENHLTQSMGGTGLGLYMCMKLAQRLGAKVWCKSVLNEGSTFFIELPQQSDLLRDKTEVARAQVSALVDGL